MTSGSKPAASAKQIIFVIFLLLSSHNDCTNLKPDQHKNFALERNVCQSKTTSALNAGLAGKAKFPTPVSDLNAFFENLGGSSI